EACLAEEFFIPIKFSARALLSAQENLQSEENDSSFSSGASTLSMPRGDGSAVPFLCVRANLIRSACAP
ncbi:MAG: hypothetical protein IJ664_06370, partial [Clostridia bacterium]|nr:hypothetical protein [Clostridia bacterium]